MRILLISEANDAGSMVPLPLGLACVGGEVNGLAIRCGYWRLARMPFVRSMFGMR